MMTREQWNATRGGAWLNRGEWEETKMEMRKTMKHEGTKRHAFFALYATGGRRRPPAAGGRQQIDYSE
jgi:hypothetical protein